MASSPMARFANAGITSLLAITLLLFATTARSAPESDSQALKQALSGVDWKKASKPIATDASFLKSVRELFEGLTEDAKKKATASIISLREGRGPIVTNTPVDGLIRLRLASSLSRYIVDAPAKRALTAIEENGTLQDLLIAAGALPASASTSAAAGASSAPAPMPAAETPSVKGVNGAAPSTVEVQRWVSGKTWNSESGTKWTFEKDGSGNKVHGKIKVAITWRPLPSGLIEVSGRDTPEMPVRIWFMQFKSRSEAIYGTAPESMTVKLHRDG